MALTLLDLISIMSLVLLWSIADSFYKFSINS